MVDFDGCQPFLFSTCSWPSLNFGNPKAGTTGSCLNINLKLDTLGLIETKHSTIWNQDQGLKKRPCRLCICGSFVDFVDSRIPRYNCDIYWFLYLTHLENMILLYFILITSNHFRFWSFKNLLDSECLIHRQAQGLRVVTSENSPSKWDLPRNVVERNWLPPFDQKQMPEMLRCS